MHRHVLVSLFASLAVLLSIGCGNVKTGEELDPGATGTPVPGDDDDDDGTTPPPPGGGGTWEPGPVPAQIGGMATFSRFRDRSVGDTAGAFDDFVGMVMFFPVPAPVPPTLQAVYEDFPAMEMDSCERVYPSSVGLASNMSSPSAGDVTFEGPNGNLSLSPMLGMGMYMSIWNDANKYVPMSDYVLRATGAQIGAFEIPFKSPGLITTITPDISAVTPFVVDRTVPMNLKWGSVPDGRPIYIFLEQKDSPESQEWVWMCKVLDDGDFTIPTAMLQDFGATVPPFMGEEWRDKISLRRWHYGSFTVPNGVAPILSAFESGWYADVQLE